MQGEECSWTVFLVTDGSLYMATPVDPVFILLPIFDEARMKVGRSLYAPLPLLEFNIVSHLI